MSVIGVPIIAGASSTKLNSVAVAPDYSASATYAVGDLVTYKSALYRCKTAIGTAEVWTAAHWDAVDIDALLGNKADADSLEMIAPAYSASATYAVGDRVIHDGGLYECKTAIATAEAWNAAHWDAVTVSDEIDDVQDNLDDLGFSIDNNGILNQTVGSSATPLITDATGQRILNALYQINGGYYKNDYKSIVKAVRAGNADKVPIGTIFTVPHEVFGNIDFVVRRRNVDRVHGDSSKPTLTIQSKYLLSNGAGSTVKTFQYDRPEAFATITSEIAAGSVCKFTTIAYGGWVAGTWHFTAAETIAVGSKLCIDKYQDTALGSCNVLVFASAKATTASATYAISSGDGDATVNLGTWGTECNHPQRVSYGSNNEVESNFFQWLNGRGLMSNTWTPQTKFDMLGAGYVDMFGFLDGFSQDFLDCLGLCDIHNITNDVYESTDSQYAKSQEYTHTGYFWLPSRKEIYGSNENTRESSETQFPYFANVGTSDADKLMYAKGAGSATSYWLRTPYAGHASTVRICLAGYGGALVGNGAYGSYGVAPLAILA